MATSTTRGSIITVAGSTALHRPADEVFAYVANLANDPAWRAEIQRTEMKGEPGPGVQAEEHSYLSKKLPDNVYQLACTSYQAGKNVVYETIAGSPYSLRSARTVSAGEGNGCTFHYELQFDSRIVKKALGFQLPKWLVAYKAKTDLEKYLAALRKCLP